MKRIAALLCVVIGCRTVPMANAPGATTPRATVEALLAAANAQDLQAVSAVLGDEMGLLRDREGRAEMESRAFIIACVLKNDSNRIGDAQPLGNGRMILSADLTQGKNSGTIRFELAPTKNMRWLAANFDLSVLQNKGFCEQPGRP